MPYENKEGLGGHLSFFTWEFLGIDEKQGCEGGTPSRTALKGNAPTRTLSNLFEIYYEVEP